MNRADGRRCETARYRLDKSFDEIVLFDPGRTSIWPGALVQAPTLAGGVPTLITVPRAEATIVLDGDSVVVPSADRASTAAAIETLLGGQQRRFPARMTFAKTRARHLTQALAEVGISAQWLVGDAKASLRISEDADRTVLLARLTQVYYTVEFQAPPNVDALFGRDVRVADLRYWMSPEVPPAYIDSVSYGRLLILKITSSARERELEAALDAAVNPRAVPLVGAGIEANTDYRQLLDEATIEVVAIGGDATAAIGVIDPGALDDYLRAGAQWSPESPGAPISFSARFVADNSIARIGTTSEYEVTTCTTQTVHVRVVLDGIYVVHDCEGAGSGDFTYRILVNGELLASAAEPIKADTGEWLTRGGALAWVGTIPDVASKCLSITGDFQEIDDGIRGDNDRLSPFSRTHCQQNAWQAGRHSVVVGNPDRCAVRVDYTLSLE